MKLFFAIHLLFLSAIAGAQSSTGLQLLVNTENAFARLSREKSTKQAFSTYLSDSAVVFQPGPVPGKEFWMNAVEGNELFQREPVFASIAASGDLGYTPVPGSCARTGLIQR